jgi:uncharacterized protein involved in exopolysaccharide biosynthesis
MNRIENHSSADNGTQYYQAHLSDYLTILRRRKWFIILFWLLVMGLAAFYLYNQKQIYRATALIMIERKPSPANPLGDTETRPGSFENPYYTTEVNLLSHRTLIRQ